jgi:hypothetical protein
VHAHARRLTFFARRAQISRDLPQTEITGTSAVSHVQRAVRAAAFLFLAGERGPVWVQQGCIRIGLALKGIHVVVHAMEVYPEQPDVLAGCCQILMQLARSDCCKEAIVGHCGLPAIVKALKAHVASVHVQEFGLGALRDIIVQHTDYQVSVHRTPMQNCKKQDCQVLQPA